MDIESLHTNDTNGPQILKLTPEFTRGLLSSLLVITWIGISLGFVGPAVYRVFFHPLAGFPGPKLAASTKLYEAYFDLWFSYGGQFSNQVKRMHEIYGPIVRINPNEISINDPDFHELLYAPQPAVRDKYPPIAAVLGTTVGAFGTIGHFAHRKRRAAKSAFFSQKNIASAEPLIRKHVERLCTLLQSDQEKVWKTRPLFTALKLDIFFEFGFADSLGLLTDPVLAQRWDETMEAISSVAPWVKMFPWLVVHAMNVPIALIRALSPELARVLSLNHVRLLCGERSTENGNAYKNTIADQKAGYRIFRGFRKLQ